jgi:hypothetical protein
MTGHIRPFSSTCHHVHEVEMKLNGRFNSNFMVKLDSGNLAQDGLKACWSAKPRQPKITSLAGCAPIDNFSPLHILQQHHLLPEQCSHGWVTYQVLTWLTWFYQSGLRYLKTHSNWVGLGLGGARLGPPLGPNKTPVWGYISGLAPTNRPKLGRFPTFLNKS